MENDIPLENDVPLYEAVLRSAKKDFDATAFIYMNKTFSYKKLIDETERLARALKKFGIKKGDVVTVCLPNIPQTVYCLYAVNRVGAVCHFLHALSSPEHAAAQMEKTNSKLLFAFSFYIEKFVEICRAREIELVNCSPVDELSNIKKSLFFMLKGKAKNVKSYKEFCDFYINKKPQLLGLCYYKQDMQPAKNTAVLLNSGGTAGVEKTIELSSYAINALSSTVLDILDLDCMKNKGMMSALPYFHGFGLAMNLHGFLYHGGYVVMMPKFRRKEAIKYVKKGKIHYMIGVPALYNALLSHKKFKGNALKNVMTAFVGGDFVPQSLIERFDSTMRENSSPGRMLEGYGLTESVTVVCVNRHSSNKPKTVGKPLKGIKVAAFATENYEQSADIPLYTRLESNVKGELCVGGETLMNGYFGDDEATKNAFFIDSDGEKWLKTGDCGYIDEDGFVVFVQRIKRLIKVSGENVFPSQIEQVVSQIPGIGQVCAFAVPDIKKGSVVNLAVEIFEKNKEDMQEEILRLLKRSVSPPSYPKKIFFLEKFPLTKMNKIDCAKLEELCAELAAKENETAK